MPAITSLDLSNAKLDVDHIAAIATSTLPTATDRMGNTKDTMSGAVYSIKAFNNRGAWQASTTYAVKDLVSVSGTWYVAVAPHTSNATFAVDAESYWRVYQGVTLGDLASPSAATLIGGGGQVVATISALRGLIKTAPSKNAFVTGYYTSGDGGGGHYWLDASDTTGADNGGSVIVADDGGRWKLVWSGRLSVRQFGAKGDYNLTTFSGTNDAAALQACATALLVTGGEMYHPPGNYYTNAEILIDRAPGLLTDDFIRVSVTGAGSGASQVVSQVTAGNAYRIAGYIGAGVHSYQTISGLRFRAVGGVFVGTAIRIDKFSLGVFDDVVVENFEYAINGSDVLSSHFRRCVFRGNAYGANLSRSSSSHPNAISFDACIFTAQKYWAMVLGSPSALTIVGGSIEGNGTDSGASSRGGVLMTNPGIEGATGIAALGVYFEGNGGHADFYSSSAGAGGGSVAFSFSGCTFNRIAAEQFVENNIRIEGEAKASLSVTGCGFKRFNDYVADAARPYIKLGFADANLITFSDAGNMYGDAVEAPKRSRTVLAPTASPFTYTNSSGGQQSISILASPAVTSLVYVRNGFGDPVPVTGVYELSDTDQVIVTYPGSAPVIIVYTR